MKTKIFEFDPAVYPIPLLVCKYVRGVTYAEIAGRFNKVIDRRTLETIRDDELMATPTILAKTVCVTKKEDDKMFYLVILYRPKLVNWGVVARVAARGNYAL